MKWESFFKVDRSLNWSSFLEKPDNVFDGKFVDERLEKLEDKMKCRFIKGLNKISECYPGLIKKRQVPMVRREQR